MLNVLIIGLIAGGVVGLWPLVVGIRGGQRTLGIAGFFATLIGGVALGLLLAVPVAVFFAWLIARKKQQAVPADESDVRRQMEEK